MRWSRIVSWALVVGTAAQSPSAAGAPANVEVVRAWFALRDALTPQRGGSLSADQLEQLRATLRSGANAPRSDALVRRLAADAVWRNVLAQMQDRRQAGDQAWLERRAASFSGLNVSPDVRILLVAVLMTSPDWPDSVRQAVSARSWSAPQLIWKDRDSVREFKRWREKAGRDEAAVEQVVAAALETAWKQPRWDSTRQALSGGQATVKATRAAANHSQDAASLWRDLPKSGGPSVKLTFPKRAECSSLARSWADVMTGKKTMWRFRQEMMAAATAISRSRDFKGLDELGAAMDAAEKAQKDAQTEWRSRLEALPSPTALGTRAARPSPRADDETQGDGLLQFLAQNIWTGQLMPVDASRQLGPAPAATVQPENGAPSPSVDSVRKAAAFLIAHHGLLFDEDSEFQAAKKSLEGRYMALLRQPTRRDRTRDAVSLAKARAILEAATQPSSVSEEDRTALTEACIDAREIAESASGLWTELPPSADGKPTPDHQLLVSTRAAMAMRIALLAADLEERSLSLANRSDRELTYAGFFQVSDCTHDMARDTVQAVWKLLAGEGEE